jgi:hypothetical protein
MVISVSFSKYYIVVVINQQHDVILRQDSTHERAIVIEVHWLLFSP